MKVAELNASMMNKFTFGEQKDIVNIYLNFLLNHVNKLNADMVSILVQLTQR